MKRGTWAWDKKPLPLLTYHSVFPTFQTADLPLRFFRLVNAGEASPVRPECDVEARDSRVASAQGRMIEKEFPIAL